MMSDTMAGIASKTIRGLNVVVKGSDIEESSSCPGHLSLEEGAVMPRKGRRNSAGYDVFANASVRIEKGTTRGVPLGFSFRPIPGTYGQLQETSTWARMNPNLQLRAEVLDPDYCGELFALFTYTGTENFGYIKRGDRVAQLVGVCFRADPFQIMGGRLPATGRGEKVGFKETLVEEDPACPDVDIRPTARYHLPYGTLSWCVGRGGGASQGIQTDSGVGTLGTWCGVMEQKEASDEPAL